jgi:hypothetical protein
VSPRWDAQEQQPFAHSPLRARGRPNGGRARGGRRRVTGEVYAFARQGGPAGEGGIGTNVVDASRAGSTPSRSREGEARAVPRVLELKRPDSVPRTIVRPPRRALSEGRARGGRTCFTGEVYAFVRQGGRVDRRETGEREIGSYVVDASRARSTPSRSREGEARAVPRELELERPDSVPWVLVHGHFDPESGGSLILGGFWHR